jgi:hypothetical protein
MAGAKIEQAKGGAVEFAYSAIRRGYATALAIFAAVPLWCVTRPLTLDVLANCGVGMDVKFTLQIGVIPGTDMLTVGSARFRLDKRV